MSDIAQQLKQAADFTNPQPVVISTGALYRAVEYIRKLENDLMLLKVENEKFHDPKNWTRPFNHEGALIADHALYKPNLSGDTKFKPLNVIKAETVEHVCTEFAYFDDLLNEWILYEFDLANYAKKLNESL